LPALLPARGQARSPQPAIRNADRLIVLHHGEIREIGSHAELMERQGIYYRLYQLQYEREELKHAPQEGAAKISLV
jgi:ABC-type multidrug transport system ATPase subunit